MNARMIWCLFATLLPLSAAEVVTITGRVLNSVTNGPIEQATVIFQRADRGNPVLSPATWETKPSVGEPGPAELQFALLTDGEGVFRCTVEAPVTFRLFVRREGYVRKNEMGRPYDSKDAGPITIRMDPEGSISGRVIDVETDKPVKGLAVQPMKFSTWDGGRTLHLAGGAAVTDAEGRYFLKSMPPGEYYLQVAPPMARAFQEPKPVEDFANAVEINFGRTWYPGVSEAGQSPMVNLPIGSTVSGIDFRVTKVRTATLRGKLGSVPGNEKVGVTLMEYVKGLMYGSYMTQARGKLGPGQAFEIDQITPGRYILLSTVGDRNSPDRMVALKRVDVGERNIDTGALEFHKGITVTGRVRMKGREPKPEENVLTEDVALALREPELLSISGGMVTASAKDGAFTQPGMALEEYEVTVAKAPKGYKLAEVHYNGVPCPGALLTLDPAAPAHELNLLLAPATGSVQVTVTDGSRALPGATVLAYPWPAGKRISMSQLLRPKTNTDGKASLADLLPGTYRLIAYPTGALWGNDPNLLQRIAAGTEVAVREGVPAVLEVRAQTGY